MKTIGSIGLGAMGGSYAKFLIEDNYTVYGVDPDTQNAEIFIDLGGILLNNISELVDKSDVIILSLPTVPIFKEVINEIFDLFVALDANDHQLDFPVLYASGRSGWATKDIDGPRENLTPLLDLVMKHVKPVSLDKTKPFF